MSDQGLQMMLTTAAATTSAALEEPLLGGGPSSSCPPPDEGFSRLDADTLEDLRALEEDLMEAGGLLAADEQYLEEDEVYKMKELILEKPKDVIQYIEEEGVVKLGEFEVQVSGDTGATRGVGGRGREDRVRGRGGRVRVCCWMSCAHYTAR